MCSSYVCCYFLGLAFWYEVVLTCNKNTQLQFILFLLSPAVVPSTWLYMHAPNTDIVIMRALFYHFWLLLSPMGGEPECTPAPV